MIYDMLCDMKNDMNIYICFLHIFYLQIFLLILAEIESLLSLYFLFYFFSTHLSPYSLVFLLTYFPTHYVAHYIDKLGLSFQYLDMILYYQIGDLMKNFRLLRRRDPL